MTCDVNNETQFHCSSGQSRCYVMCTIFESSTVGTILLIQPFLLDREKVCSVAWLVMYVRAPLW